jgi:ankyrin repeat protein
VRAAFGSLILAGILAGGVGKASPQSPNDVDFARDVQPILVERCVGCHGPTRQESGYRVDRRSDAFRGALRPTIVPGSSDGSVFYQRVSGTRRGLQMPPTGPLSSVEMETLRRWIDEGARWPDALANDVPAAPPDSDATRLIESIRRPDRASARAQLRATPGVVNRRGPAGSTPLMHAALAGDAILVREMLKNGADVNLRNEAAASALMWGIESREIVGLLLDAGADPNATSAIRRTPLMLAAMQTGGDEVVRLLLQRGATPTSDALIQAAWHGRATVVRLLIAAGSRDATGEATARALSIGCGDCVDEITKTQGWPQLSNALGVLLPPVGSGADAAVRAALAHGADTKMTNPRLWPVLPRAAMSEGSADVMGLIVDRGAALDGATPEGLSALDVARRSGRPDIERVLSRAGVRATLTDPAPSHAFVRPNSVEAAIRRSLPLVQRTALSFYKAVGCVSCHHNAVAQMAVAEARRAGFAIDEAAAQEDVATTAADVNASLDQAVQLLVTPGGHATTAGYVLMGLAASEQPRDAGTDAMVRLLRLRQLPDGRWFTPYRPPIEASEVTATAISVRGLKAYGSTPNGSADAAVRAAVRWLEQVQPRDTEDRAFRLLGLTWGGAPANLRAAAMRDLVQTQRSDGGWSQRPALSSDAYATGETLVALAEAGMRADDPVYRRGVQFLLNSQLEDGSWHVRSRTHPTQTYVESGFPHGVDQFISAAATSWATVALVRAAASRTPR